eukprot:COSAG06_NODE_8236_length_2228_cov_11.997651_1_plen_69_part_00
MSCGNGSGARQVTVYGLKPESTFEATTGCGSPEQQQQQQQQQPSVVVKGETTLEGWRGQVRRVRDDHR